MKLPLLLVLLIGFFLGPGEYHPTSAELLPIAGLFGTGQAADGSLLPDGEIDPHYLLAAFPSNSEYGSSTFVVNAGYPIGPGAWFENGPGSKWIGPRADMATASPLGEYRFRTTFDLSGFDPVTVAIQGLWSTDNAGVDILLNGVSTGITNPNGPGSPPVTLSYWQFSPFALTGGFLAGLNTLDFVVSNGPGTSLNPVGLRVELSGTGSRLTAVPEPSSVVLLLGLVGTGLIATARHRKRIV